MLMAGENTRKILIKDRNYGTLGCNNKEDRDRNCLTNNKAITDKF